jgi:acetyl-CoA carboxylase biotin carboxyl carrier protein
LPQKIHALKIGKGWFDLMEINADIIKELIGCLNSSTLDILKLETDQFKLTLERSKVIVSDIRQAPALEVNSVTVAVPESKKETEPLKGNIIRSPIVGTFYASASPDKPSFVKVGQHVKRGDTIYVVESMKLMNEVTSEFDGAVTEILVQNGQPVEYGQPIMRIE